MVPAEEADKEIFLLLEEFLETLDARESKTSHDLWASLFTLKILAQLGYKPELYNCVICHNKITPGDNLFDFGRGGLMGKECLNKKGNEALEISDGGIKLLRAIIDNGFKKLKNFKISAKLETEIKNIISSFFQYYT